MRLLLLACVVAACGKGPPVVARLERVDAVGPIASQVERMPEADAAWEPADVGDKFIIGSAVRTGRDSRAHLRLGASGKLDVDPVSIVYFRRRPDRERNEVRMETGRAVLESGDEAVSIGDAVLESGSRARVERSGNQTTLVVEIGRAVIEDSSTIPAGDQVTFDENGKRIIKPPPKQPEPVREARPGSLAVKISGKAASAKTKAGTAALEPGDHEVEVGATVTAPEGSTVEVTRGTAHLVVTGPAEVQLTGAPETLATVTRGGAVIRSDEPAVVAVPGGTVAVTGEAAAQIDPEGATVAARKGDTTVRSPKREQKLSPGELATLSKDGTIEVLPAPPARTLVAVSAGESPVLHDPGAPTPVRIQFGDNCASAIVELARDRTFKRPIARSSGAGAANIAVPAGSYAYRVRCDGGKDTRGTLQVVRDSGRAPLPKTAARTTVEMDGREYTILYQNLLPELTLTWRNAPFAVGYTFVVKANSGAERKFQSPTSKVILKSGELAEGTYKVWAEPQGAVRSETGRIVIEFDNATPTAQLDGVDSHDGKLTVKGTVLEGSSVTANGAKVELDRHRRFTTELAPGAGQDGVGIRIAHPKLGVHYYVLRVSPK